MSFEPVTYKLNVEVLAHLLLKKKKTHSSTVVFLLFVIRAMWAYASPVMKPVRCDEAPWSCPSSCLSFRVLLPALWHALASANWRLAVILHTFSSSLPNPSQILSQIQLLLISATTFLQAIIISVLVTTLTSCLLVRILELKSYISSPCLRPSWSLIVPSE